VEDKWQMISLPLRGLLLLELLGCLRSLGTRGNMILHLLLLILRGFPGAITMHLVSTGE
jgi:hypothetical protein